MEIERIKRLRRQLTLHFSVIAFTTAILVANNGTGDIFLPALILLVATSAFVLVDLLEVFHLAQFGSYIGMSVATFIALTTMIVAALRGSESDQLMSVASLLIYPQCVLFFQKKSLRVFEQLAIFLLLQMIVAALINDNVLYGILLTPMILVWVSSLVLFARYATLVQLCPHIEEPVPLLYELIYAKFLRPVLATKQEQPTVLAEPKIDPQLVENRGNRRWLLSVPMGVGALLFAGSLFYLLPRTGQETNLSSLSFVRSGIPDRILSNFFGRMISDPTPVFRLKLFRDGRAFQPNEPPYLRVETFDLYRPPSREREQASWSRSSLYPIRERKVQTPRVNLSNRDRIRVDIKAKENNSRIGSRLLVSMPPHLGVNEDFIYDSYLMIFEQIGQEHKFANRKSLQYSYYSAAFQGATQIKVTPDYAPELAVPLSLARVNMPLLDQLRKEVLKRENVSAEDRYQVAQTLTNYFTSSGNFNYSMNIPPIMEPTIDPIEDFVINTRTGICQHYASALTMLLRQSGIAARIVVGYKPVEWNKMGEFFQVRNSDAHAWVEAQFRRDELEGTELARWLTDEEYYWVLLDPTPSADEESSQILAQNSPLDYAEDLWDDYLSSTNLNAASGTYAPVAAASQDSAAKILDQLKSWKRFIVDEWFYNLGFAWQLTLLIIMGGVLPVAAWQLARWLPGSSFFSLGRLRTKGSSSNFRQPFFARCMALLEKLSLYRPDSETPQEYSQRALRAIQSQTGEREDARDALNALSRLYYELRFGKNEQIPPEKLAAIDQYLQIVEAAVKEARQDR